jgi:hypothetical protein
LTLKRLLPTYDTSYQIFTTNTTFLRGHCEPSPMKSGKRGNLKFVYYLNDWFVELTLQIEHHFTRI